MASHNLYAAPGHVEVFREQFDDRRIGLPVDGALLHEHGENLAIRRQLLLDERALSAARFDSHGDVHGSRLTRATETGRHPKVAARLPGLRWLRDREAIVSKPALIRLAAQPEALDECAVPVDVDVRQVAEQTAALAHQQKQPTT